MIELELFGTRFWSVDNWRTSIEGMRVLKGCDMRWNSGAIVEGSLYGPLFVGLSNQTGPLVVRKISR